MWSLWNHSQQRVVSKEKQLIYTICNINKTWRSHRYIRKRLGPLSTAYGRGVQYTVSHKLILKCRVACVKPTAANGQTMNKIITKNKREKREKRTLRHVRRPWIRIGQNIKTNTQTEIYKFTVPQSNQVSIFQRIGMMPAQNVICISGHSFCYVSKGFLKILLIGIYLFK